MNASEITFGINGLISIIISVGSGLAIWYNLKSKVDLLEVQNENFKENCERINSETDETKVLFNKRIDTLKTEVKENRQRSDDSTKKLESAMNRMELRIIKAIHEIGKK